MARGHAMRTTNPSIPVATIAFASFIGCAQSVPDNNWGFDSMDEAADASTSTAGSDAPATSSTGEADGSGSAQTPDEDSSGAADDAPASSEGGEASIGDEGPASTDDGAPAESSEGGGGETYDYGRCNDGCAADMCITIDGFDGSFCTTTCVDGECPQPADGDAVGQCLLGPDLTMPPVNCVLTCSVAGQDCPGEMACVDAMMGGDAGICLWQ